MPGFICFFTSCGFESGRFCLLSFQVCISAQRCFFLLDPFSARRWRRRYDLFISIAVWIVVGLACSPFILMRTNNSNTITSTGVTSQTIFNESYILDAASTQRPSSDVTCSVPPLNTSTSSSKEAGSTNTGCFKDLPTRRLPLSLAVTMMVLAELFGFLIPLACISYSSIRISRSLSQKRTQDPQTSTTINSSARSRLQSVTSMDSHPEKQNNLEKRRGLQMVLGCFALFLLCFVPYHINFLLYLMVSQDIVSNCSARLAVRQFHPVSLCLASLSCCLNPLLYFFLTAEFRLHLTKRTSSFTSLPLSSPISSPTVHPDTRRLMSVESSYSDRE